MDSEELGWGFLRNMPFRLRRATGSAHVPAWGRCRLGGCVDFLIIDPNIPVFWEPQCVILNHNLHNAIWWRALGPALRPFVTRLGDLEAHASEARTAPRSIFMRRVESTRHAKTSFHSRPA
jgi:hypothetical protein